MQSPEPGRGSADALNYKVWRQERRCEIRHADYAVGTDILHTGLRPARFG